MWVVEQNILGSTVLDDIADNGNFAINLVDMLSGDSNLISLRVRTVSSRPFERIEKIQRSAELRYHDKQSQLQSDLDALNQKLAKIQGGNSAAGAAQINAAQKTEITKYQKQKTLIRNELRLLQRRLNADIENLVGNLKLINILLVPGLVALFAFLLGLRRLFRRRSHAHA
jgi:ABC-type uncharacterized transport system involved in gliding motility auxiliary subunit